ncbi:MAG TPA: hypothetical protein ENI69_06900, partial [Rhodospirillales bacterium]|nr:hypothetical protein [Rhodospirillales bacterium]
MKTLVLMVGLLFLATPVLAAASKTDLQRVEKQLSEGRAQRDALKKKARSYSAQLQDLKSEMVEAGAAIHNTEADAMALEDRLAELSLAEAKTTDRLQARRGQFGQVLMALQRMASNPPEAMIAAPQSPIQTLRSTMLLGAVAPQIERRAAQLRIDLNSVAEARARTVAKRQQLALALSGLAEDRRYLTKLMGEKNRLKKQADAGSRRAEKRIADLVGKARSLRDLMARLEADRKAQAKKNPPKKALPAFNKSRGKMPFPAIGRLVGLYGQATETGLTRKGITIETRPGAQVVAPYEGVVMFAGAFKGYGQLLIIGHGGGYHSLLAGL